MKSLRFFRRFEKMLLVLAVGCFALMPLAARTDSGVPIQGVFAVTVVTSPNTSTPPVSYCGGTPLSFAVEGHGNGMTSLGALSFSLLKTIDLPGPMHGCLTLTAPNGDLLNAVYDGTIGGQTVLTNNPNGFIPASGTFRFTGGTGRFQHATGTANFTAVFLAIYQANSFIGGTTSPLQIAGYYSFQGTLSQQGD